MKTLICIPALDSVNTSFMRCLLSLRPVGEVRFAITQSSLIYDARNILSVQAITGGFDRVMWLDSDMIFEPDLMERLSKTLDEGYDLVSGLYFTRKPPHRPVIYDGCRTFEQDGKTRCAAIWYGRAAEQDQRALRNSVFPYSRIRRRPFILHPSARTGREDGL